MTLSFKDRVELIALLVILETHLESSIESSLGPDGFVDEIDRENVQLDRDDLALAAEWRFRFENPKVRRRKPGTANVTDAAEPNAPEVE